MTGPTPRKVLRGGGIVAVTGTALALALTGCGSSSGNGPSAALSEAAVPVQAGAPAAAPAGQGTQSAPTQCSPAAQASFPPSSATSFPNGSLQAQIRKRGTLVVGVSGDTRLLGARDFLNGGAFGGFDIDMARIVARAVFDLAPTTPAAEVDKRIQWKVITAGQRFPLVNQGVGDDLAKPTSGVDLVARAVSATCDRWSNQDLTKGALFSVGYLQSAQRLLVRQDLVTDDKVNSLKDLVEVLHNPQNTDKDRRDARVCAPSSSTSLTNIQKVSGVTPIAVPIHSDCMALWQEGKVDAITGDDAILAGFKDQDPHAAIVGPAIDSTYYALAIGRQHREFVQFVNAVLTSGEGRAAWTKAYERNLAAALPDLSEPAPDTTRPVGWKP
jgi:polar amino acid transport system substrate-binding protein